MLPKKPSKRLIIPIFLNHKGCNHRCIFCNQRSAVGISLSSIEEIKSIVNSYINSQVKKFGKINPKYESVQIAFYGGSFTCLEKKIMIKYLKQAYFFVENNKVNSLRISTRPDCINPEIIKILKDFKVKTIEIGGESFDNQILQILKRGHSVNDILISSELIKKNNLELTLQLMVGLPNETKETHELNKKFLLKIKPNFLRIFPLVVLKNTELENMYRNNLFYPLSLKEAIEVLKDYYIFCEKVGIKIIQMGLHYSTHLLENYVAGPLHPSLKDIIKNLITN